MHRYHMILIIYIIACEIAFVILIDLSINYNRKKEMETHMYIFKKRALFCEQHCDKNKENDKISRTIT